LAAERARSGLPWRARARWLLCCLVLALAWPAAPPANADAVAIAPGEVEVEAAYLVNFLRYTQWPASTFPSANSPYVLTVVGPEGVVASVRAVAAAAGPIEGRVIEVRWIPDARGSRAAPFDSPQDLESAAQMRASHLVFFHRSAGRVHPQVLADLARLPVLTVSDTDGFTGDGGMLGLVRSDSRIVFQANPGAIRNANLLVSAKVLKLARASMTRTVP
jgi:hypothetical protein